MNYFISVIEDSKLIRKTIEIDKKRLRERIIKELSDIRYQESIKLKGTSENSIDNQIKHTCHYYSDLKPRYLVDSKMSKEEQERFKHLYIYTAYYYPELYFTMERLLMNKELDLSILNKYLSFKEADDFHINDYIEEGYKSYNKVAREQIINDLAKDSQLALTHAKEVRERRRKQGLWLNNLPAMMRLIRKEEKIAGKANLEEYKRAKENTEVLAKISELEPKIIDGNNNGSQKIKKIFSVC